MVYLLEGKDITDSHFVYKEITYPSNWAKLATQEEKDKLGIKELEEVWPQLNSSEYYVGTYYDTETQRIYNKASMNN